MAILMCPPQYFDVEYVINPWMDGNVGKVDIKLAEEEWNYLVDKIIGVGETVIQAKPQKNLPDMVFTANAGLPLFNGSVIVSNFKNSQRQPETKHWIDFFKHYFSVIEIPTAFEGAGDALFDENKMLWLASGFRSDPETMYHIKKYHHNIETLELINPSFYHLDTAFCPLNGNFVLYNPDAFSDNSNDKIKNYFGDNAICVSSTDADNFACNAVNISNKIILNKASNTLKQTLSTHGFDVIETPMTQFLKSGGGCKCLTLKI